MSQQQLSTQDHFFAPLCWVLSDLCLGLALEAEAGAGRDSGSCSDMIDSESEDVGGGGGREAEEEGVAVVGFLFRSSDMVMVRGGGAERERMGGAPVERCGSECASEVFVEGGSFWWGPVPDKRRDSWDLFVGLI